MGFWDGYRASLKPIDVEEPIDRWVHRPLGYVVARVLFPTPVSPDLVTLFAIFAGWGAAACICFVFPWHMQVAAALVLLSTVLDCSDGQLARMRKTSSPFGRMLDGVADSFVVAALAPATVYGIWRQHHEPAWLGWAVLGGCAVALVTSSFHTATYDHYKNLWVRFTSETYREGEDEATARARYEATKHEASWVMKIVWPLYLAYVKSQEDVVRKFDPHTALHFGDLPPRTEASEATYRAHVSRPWAIIRGWFGFGSLMFGLMLAALLDRGDAYLLFRVVLLNGLFYLVVRPMQRRASRAAFAALRG
ncbi:MAG: CDP-alcohol phosphatidyltransferase family protein [Polyangiaceae bacterium]|nr:CDP-alcohol phosphatidyltransferase family protein [Polyangiaceae bacterium]